MRSLYDSAPTGVHGKAHLSLGSEGSRLTPNCSMGFARLAETGIRNVRGKSEHDQLGALDKILASSVGGALATWNQPIEVIRVEVRALIFCLRGT